MRSITSRKLSIAIVALFVAALLVPAIALATTSLKLSGSTTVYPCAQVLATQYHKRYPTVAVTVTGGGSGVGISDVLAGRVGIGMSSRDLKSTEIASGAKATAFAKDALTVIVNKGNPVANLSEYQIRQIYLGKITNWKSVGGPNARIIICGRTAASGTYEMFKEKFLLGSRQSSMTRQYASNGMVRSAVYQNRYAIGYVGMAFVNTSIKALKVGGVYPSRTNARSGTYKYVRNLYWVTKGTPAGTAKAFINWTLTSTGQGYVDTQYLRIK